MGATLSCRGQAPDVTAIVSTGSRIAVLWFLEGGANMCLGIPARIVEAIDVSGQRVLVDLQGKQQQVSAAMLMSDETDLPGPGDWVVVHLGFALSRMDEAEAQSVLQSLNDLSDLYADELQAHASMSEAAPQQSSEARS